MRTLSRSVAAVAMLSALAAGPALAQQAPSAPPPPPAGTKTAPDASPGPGAAKDAPKKTPAPQPADENAFPEAQSEAAQKQATAQEKSDANAADSGSVEGASEKAGSSSREKLSGLDILGDNQARTSNGAGGTVVDPKLAATDLRVGQQYMGMGNYQGAYDRFKEATVVNPGNADAVFYLAEAARKTAHLDESAEDYRIFLQAQPEGPKAKTAKKALAQLQGK